MVLWWLIAVAFFLSIRLNFINFTFVGKAFRMLFLSNSEHHKGGGRDVVQISPFTAFASQAAGNLGLGNIAGAALALNFGGPGVVVWMIAGAFLFSIIKFAEITLGHKYRTVDRDGTVHGGPFHYIRHFFKSIGYHKTALIASYMVAIVILIIPTVWSAFQINQIVSVIIDPKVAHLRNATLLLSAVIMIVIGFILIGGIKRIGAMANMIVPCMALGYCLMCAVVIIYHYDNLLPTIQLIFRDAFSIKSSCCGIATTLLVSIQRMIFATEAGMGTAAMIHANANVDSPIRQGLIGLIDCLIITFCLVMGCLTLLISRVEYLNNDVVGIQLVDLMFTSFFGPLHYGLMIIVFLFGFTSLIGNGYYAQKAFHFIFGHRAQKICILLYITTTFILGVDEIKEIISVADSVIMLVFIPNTITICMLSGNIRKDLLKFSFNAGKK
jgi:alanine or glycine:cation symporter, AGCS family